MRKRLSRVWKLRKRADWNRLAQYGFDAIGFVGLIVVFCAKEFAKMSLEPDLQMWLYLIIGVLLLWFRWLGVKHYRYMEQEAIREQREESRRVIRKSAS